MEGNVSLEETEWEKMIRGEERIWQKGMDGRKVFEKGRDRVLYVLDLCIIESAKKITYGMNSF
jgi:hypothetical protein